MLKIKNIIAISAVALVAGSATAADTKGGVRLVDPSMTRNGDLMTVSTGISFDDLKVKSSGATVISPMIVNGADTLRLPTVGVYGRTSWYTSQRNNRMPLGGVAESVTMRYSKNMAPVEYSESVPYAEWMNGSEFIVERIDYGCAGCDQGHQVSELARYKNVKYVPTLIYQAVVADEVKTRELSGRAYVDFPVNQTVIYPDYRRNSIELAKIIGTIDSVRNDKDITVTSLTIKGFASPEGSYSNNIRLAKGRTAALKEYVQGLYRFAPGFIKTSYEPEDWEGLREYVMTHDIENKGGILTIIDSDLAPDPKNDMLQATYPVQYSFLHQVVYPGLRHSDYTIEYTIRSFSNPVEIREIIRTAPQKLSLGEMYLAVRGLKPGSEEYNDIFETAVRMYPAVPAANLNAANAAMQRGDLKTAGKYLPKAGDSAEAVYARGVYAAMNGDFKTGIELMEQAQKLGLQIDKAIMDHVREAVLYN